MKVTHILSLGLPLCHDQTVKTTEINYRYHTYWETSQFCGSNGKQSSCKHISCLGWHFFPQQLNDIPCSMMASHFCDHTANCCWCSPTQLSVAISLQLEKDKLLMLIFRKIRESSQCFPFNLFINKQQTKSHSAFCCIPTVK